MLTARHDRVFLPLLAGLIGLAWLALIVWGQSPYGRYLSHDALAELRLDGRGALLLVFVGGWTLMTIAMMLPTSLPLITMFRRMTASQADAGRLSALLLGGYLAVWVLFGVAVHLADLGLHQIIGASATLERHAWLIGSGTVLLAGLYQFTALKYRCLDECRSPLTFIASHWSGRNRQRSAFRLGLDHGIFCVGCCWSLMLVMFAVGHGNLGWMFLLGAVMAVEKNLAWGRQMSAPLGYSLVGAGIALILLGLV